MLLQDRSDIGGVRSVVNSLCAGVKGTVVQNFFGYAILTALQIIPGFIAFAGARSVTSQ
jgi:hypothetical protein